MNELILPQWDISAKRKEEIINHARGVAIRELMYHAVVSNEREAITRSLRADDLGLETWMLPKSKKKEVCFVSHRVGIKQVIVIYKLTQLSPTPSAVQMTLGTGPCSPQQSITCTYNWVDLTALYAPYCFLENTDMIKLLQRAATSGVSLDEALISDFVRKFSMDGWFMTPLVFTPQKCIRITVECDRNLPYVGKRWDWLPLSGMVVEPIGEVIS